MAAGIGVIYQERQIMLELSVGENIFLGRLPTGFMGKIRWQEVGIAGRRRSLTNLVWT